MKWLISSTLSLGLLVSTAIAGAAQDAPQVMVGGHLTYARAIGDFAQFVDDGFGITGHAVFAVTPDAALGLRFDLGFLQYGSQTRRTSFSGSGGLIALYLKTSNQIFFGGVGPEIGIPVGRGRIYGFGTGGYAYFITHSSLEGVNDNDEFGRTTNLSDGTFAWTSGGGIRLPISGGDFPVVIDLFTVYHGNGDATYLTPDGIRDIGGGELSIQPVRSETRLVTYRIGVSVLLGGRNPRGR